VKRLLSTRDLAAAIGVEESSVRASAADGRLTIARTRGGHRRIPIAEAVRFIRASAAVVQRPELLGFPEVRGEDVTQERAPDTLYRLLYEGRGREARGLLVGRFLAGDSIAALADGPIRHAMSRLGELWQHDPRGIFLEQRGSDCCIQAVTALAAMIEPPDGAPLALGAAPPGDPYVVPAMLAAAVLTGAGMRAINLGPDTPIASLHHAAVVERPRLVWLSCSTQVDDALGAEIAILAASLTAQGARLVVGGRHRADLAAIPGAILVATMAELAAIAR
jgi:methanogenic corrinoid protein MtbC1